MGVWGSGDNMTGRSPHGERGLKYLAASTRPREGRRSPHGERGLKYPHETRRYGHGTSLSSRRAWIEIKESSGTISTGRVALLTESVD